MARASTPFSGPRQEAMEKTGDRGAAEEEVGVGGCCGPALSSSVPWLTSCCPQFPHLLMAPSGGRAGPDAWVDPPPP